MSHEPLASDTSAGLPRIRRFLERIRGEIRFYRNLLAHPETPRASRWLLGLAIAYLISPIDLIPDAIPILGQLDDLLIVPSLVGLAVLFIPSTVKQECRLRGRAAEQRG